MGGRGGGGGGGGGDGNDRLPCERFDIQPSDGQYKKGHRDSLLPLPVCLPSVFIVPDGTSCDQISQAVFVYCKRSKTGGGNGPGTTSCSYVILVLYCKF